MFKPSKSYLSIIYYNIYPHTTRNLSMNIPVPSELNEKLVSDVSTTILNVKTLTVKLQGLLDIKSSRALEIVKRNIKFTRVPEAVIDNNYNLCKSENISNETLLKYPSVLLDEEIEYKLIALKPFKKDFNTTAPLLLLSSHAFSNVLQKYNPVQLAERVQFFCDKFNMTPLVAYEAFVKKPFLIRMPIKNVERNTKLLYDRGITSEDIVRDFWVLCYSPKTIKARFDKAEEEKVEILKTWMVRGQKKIFNAYIERKSENKLILGNNSLPEYLMQQLECSFSEAMAIIERIPPIRHKSMRKLREVIDFLYGEGFTAQHIIRLPKILLHSVATSRKRLRELARIPGGYNLTSVHILTKSQKQYMQYYEATKEKANKLAKSAKVETSKSKTEEAEREEKEATDSTDEK